ncbi:hypothetical protein BBP40_006914 [Aspergillus hancockii]|nr:hypothetical protein BBP40_006914 [Aspergillus hancockii]
MDRVGGTILAQGPRGGQRKVYLYGPQVVAQAGALVAIGKIIGKDVKVTAISENVGLDQYTQAGIAKLRAEYMVQRSGSTPNELADRACYEIGVENVQLYTGEPSMQFEDWVAANKRLFRA